MAYVAAMRHHQLPLAAEYLVMAATLIELKARFLLPRPGVIDADEEDPRWRLIQRLMEYERMKNAAEMLQQLPRQGRDFWLGQVADEVAPVRRWPRIGRDDVHHAWGRLSERWRLSRHHRITREALSVREFMIRILKVLTGRSSILFGDLLQGCTRRDQVVVHFMAVLELVRESLVQVVQVEVLGPLHVTLKTADANGEVM
jgi:segregation and condensation protein A